MSIKAIFRQILQGVVIAVVVNLIFMLAPEFFYKSVGRAVGISVVLIVAIHYLVFLMKK